MAAPSTSGPNPWGDRRAWREAREKAGQRQQAGMRAGKVVAKAIAEAKLVLRRCLRCRGQFMGDPSQYFCKGCK